MKLKRRSHFCEDSQMPLTSNQQEKCSEATLPYQCNVPSSTPIISIPFSNEKRDCALSYSRLNYAETSSDQRATTAKYATTISHEKKDRNSRYFSSSLSSLFNISMNGSRKYYKNVLVSWTVVSALVLSLLFKVSVADDRVGLAAWERPKGMPKIASLEVMCGTQHMEVHLEFDSPFHGIVASKGMYHEGCVYVPARSGKNKFVFNIHYDKCGTKPDNHGKFYENTVVVQYDEELIEAWDEAKRLRCEWFNDYEKTATKTSPMVISDLEIVELNFHGDNVDCFMEIQQGKGPWAPPLTGIVPLGSTLTMVIGVKDPTGEFDMRVKDCDASDGQSGNILALSDADGCIVRPKLISQFSKIKLDDGRATVMTSAFLRSFKFPDSIDVSLRCTVEICRHGCPEHCSKLPPPPGSHIADVHGQFSDQEPIAIQSQRVEQRVNPNTLEENPNQGPEQVPPQKPNIHQQQQQQPQQQQPHPQQFPHPNQQQHPHMIPQFPGVPPQGFPPQMMHPPPPRYFQQQQPGPPLPPGMFRQPPPPPRKLIPPGLVRQRPDISGYQHQHHHNLPNMHHQIPSNLPPAPVFPSQMYKDNSPEQGMTLEQHRQQAEQVESMIIPPEHKVEESNEEDNVGRQGVPMISEENDEGDIDETIQEDANAEQMVQELDEKEAEIEEKGESHESSEVQAQKRQPSQPQALIGDISLPSLPIEDDSLSAERAINGRRPVFPKGPRSLRQRRSVNGPSDTIGVQGSFRVVSQADLNFALNSTTPTAQPTVVLRGKMRSEDLVYGVCLPRLGFGIIFFGLGVAALVAILIASFLAYAHYSLHHLQTNQQQKRMSGNGTGAPPVAMTPGPQVLPFPIIIFKKMW